MRLASIGALAAVVIASSTAVFAGETLDRVTSSGKMK